MRETLRSSRRVVIKIGTSILTSKKGLISRPVFERLAAEIACLRQSQKQVTLVSSGAIAFGMEIQGFQKRPKLLSQLQACAAVGQNQLMQTYAEAFSKKKMTTAQILLTRDGLEDRGRFLASRHTFTELFKMGALPIVNENDSVATEEIAFGDNDILSVHVAHLVHADLLVILSDVDGFYLLDGSRVREVLSEEDIDQRLSKHLKDTKKEKNVGGMKAKLAAARTAMRLGIPLVIMNGHQKGNLLKIFEGRDVGTLFCAASEVRSKNKKLFS